MTKHKDDDPHQYEYYECKRCGHRIHQSLVPPSLTGDVICGSCGRTMSRPGAVGCGRILLWAWLISIVYGAFTLLCEKFQWPIWLAILFTITFVFIILWVVGMVKRKQATK